MSFQLFWNFSSKQQKQHRKCKWFLRKQRNLRENMNLFVYTLPLSEWSIGNNLIARTNSWGSVFSSSGARLSGEAASHKISSVTKLSGSAQCDWGRRQSHTLERLHYQNEHCVLEKASLAAGFLLSTLYLPPQPTHISQPKAFIRR